jgi:CMP-N,N'-diacetyllegionaminic acid synthase
MKIVEFLILIPCRKGSKGIKNKNFIKIKNKSIYSYSLKHAKIIKSKYKSSIIGITTDKKNILKKKISDVFLINRPAKISQDKSKSSEYITHALEYFKNQKITFKNLIILQPTCPMRDKKDLFQSVKLYISKKTSSLISVYKESYINEKVIYEKNKHHGKALNKLHNNEILRQKHKPFFVRNGSIYITKIKFFEKYKKIISERPTLYLMSKLNSVNIDTKDDLEIFKKII